MLGEAGVYNTKNFNFTVNILLFLLHFFLHAPKTIGEQTPFFISKFKKTVCCEKLQGGGGVLYILSGQRHKCRSSVSIVSCSINIQFGK